MADIYDVIVLGAGSTGENVAARAARGGLSVAAVEEALVGQVPLQRLWHAVPAYPTVSEVWLWMLMDYGL